MKTRAAVWPQKEASLAPSFSAARVCESLIGPEDVVCLVAQSWQSALALGLGTAQGMPDPTFSAFPYNFETISKLWN